MTDQTADSAAASVLPSFGENADTIRGRVADFCTWFGVEPPQMQIRDRELYLTDEFLHWIRDNGVDVGWLISGGKDREAVADHRASELLMRKVLRVLKGFPKAEQPLVLKSLLRVADGADREAAFAECKAELEARRAKLRGLH